MAIVCNRQVQKRFMTLTSLGLLLTGLAVACGGGGGDGTANSSEQAGVTENETGQTDDDGASADDDCAGAADGTACGETGVCADEVCTSSRCGDGIVDARAGEECEDDNEVGGDGCTLCHFDCTSDAACDDGNACNGQESCDTAAHSCSSGADPSAQAACMLAAGGSGECRAGACVAPGCGNGLPDPGEECDDGNENDADGCTIECRYTCTTDEHCDNGNACDGEERCDRDNFVCMPGEAVVCEVNGCSGECQPEAGGCVYPDVDEDGVACDRDCADADPARFPGGFKCKDGKDNDCDDLSKDGTAPGCECYPDVDGDGYTMTTLGAVAAAGACPDKYTRTYPKDEKTTDCAPKVADAYPGQKEYFSTPYCPVGLCQVGQGSYDYNCDGDETPTLLDDRLAAATCASATNIVSCSFASGWVAKIPSCGGKGTYRACSWNDGVCSGSDIPNRALPCR